MWREDAGRAFRAARNQQEFNSILTAGTSFTSALSYALSQVAHGRQGFSRSQGNNQFALCTKQCSNSLGSSGVPFSTCSVKRSSPLMVDDKMYKFRFFVHHSPDHVLLAFPRKGDQFFILPRSLHLYFMNRISEHSF